MSKLCNVKKLFMAVLNVFIQDNHIIVTAINQSLGVELYNNFTLFLYKRLSSKSGISLSHIEMFVSLTYKSFTLFVSMVTLKT